MIVTRNLESAINRLALTEAAEKCTRAMVDVWRSLGVAEKYRDPILADEKARRRSSIRDAEAIAEAPMSEIKKACMSRMGFHPFSDDEEWLARVNAQVKEIRKRMRLGSSRG